MGTILKLTIVLQFFIKIVIEGLFRGKVQNTRPDAISLHVDYVNVYTRIRQTSCVIMYIIYFWCGKKNNCN